MVTLRSPIEPDVSPYQRVIASHHKCRFIHLKQPGGKPRTWTDLTSPAHVHPKVLVMVLIILIWIPVLLRLPHPSLGCPFISIIARPCQHWAAHARLLITAAYCSAAGSVGSGPLEPCTVQGSDLGSASTPPAALETRLRV